VTVTTVIQKSIDNYLHKAKEKWEGHVKKMQTSLRRNNNEENRIG
jgi:hypothetical protein